MLTKDVNMENRKLTQNQFEMKNIFNQIMEELKLDHEGKSKKLEIIDKM